MKQRIVTISMVFLLIIMEWVAINPVNAQSTLNDITEIRGIALHPNGQILAIGGRYNGQPGIWFYDLLTESINGIPTAGNVSEITWKPNGNAVAARVAVAGRYIEVYDIASSNLLYSFRPETYWVQTLWSSDGSQLATIADKGAHIRDSNNGNIVKTFNMPDNVLGTVPSIAWSENDNRLYGLLDFEAEILVWDTSTQSLITRYPLPFPTETLSLSHSGNRIAIGGGGRVLILDALTGDTVLDIIGISGEFVRSITWSPDDQRIAGYSTNNSENYIHVWNTSDGQLVNTILTQGFIYENTMLWSSDSATLIFSAGQDAPMFIAPPTADAGIDQNVNDNDSNGSELVSLDGSESFDTDGAIVSYDWSENGVTLATGVNPQVSLGIGIHNVILTVTDDEGAEGLDVVTVTVNYCDASPTNPAALISEITAGNSFGAPYTICLENSTYTLTQVNNSSSGDNGLPVITGNIRIIGNGATITRDVAAAGFRFFNVDALGSLTLENMTLSNGQTQPATEDGGAIYSEGSVQIDNVTFTGNVGDDGGAISMFAGNLTVANSQFSNNNAAEDGGAIEFDTGSTGDISNSTFSNNTAVYDGGAIQSEQATLTISNSQFSSNSAADDGGAITQKEGTLTISGSTLSNNVAGTNSGNVAGGIYSTGVLTLSNSHITSDGVLINTYNGGGIYYENSLGTLTINNGSSISNQIAAKNGGGIYLAAGELDLDDSTLDFNIAQGIGGGAIYNTGALDIANSSLLNNQATTNNGGAIRNTGTVSLLNVTLNNNIADTGSGKGGAIYNLAGTTTITGGTINQNQTYDGGAIYVAANTVSLSNVTLFDNDATDDGGAVYIVNGGALTAVTSTFDMNSAVDDGGAIDNRGTFTITESQFVNNSADDGGAIDTKTAGNNVINYSCIAGNIAVDDTDGVRSGETILNAENNWWGDIGGPSGAGTGLGDEVSVDVDFTPHNDVSCENALSVQGLSIASVEVNTMQFLDTQNPVELPFVASQEDEAFWQVTGTWDLVTVAGRPSPTWVVDAVPRQQESILEFIFPLELGNRANPVLAFQQKIELGGTDTFVIEVLAENSSEWIVIDSQSAISTDWQAYTIDLDAYRGQVIRLRGRLLTGDELPDGEVSTGVWLDTIGLGY